MLVALYCFNHYGCINKYLILSFTVTLITRDLMILKFPSFKLNVEPTRPDCTISCSISEVVDIIPDNIRSHALSIHKHFELQLKNVDVCATLTVTLWSSRNVTVSTIYHTDYNELNWMNCGRTCHDIEDDAHAPDIGGLRYVWNSHQNLGTGVCITTTVRLAAFELSIGRVHI